MGDRRSGSLPILVVAAVAGAGTLVVELAAARLMAPWFGTSAAVWTNVIGVVLLALSLGYMIGARLSSRGRPAAWLARTLILGGLLVALLPSLARPVCELFVPADVPLSDAAPLFFWGSLAATLVLFLPPAALLGCVGPLAVELVQARRGGHAGTAGGEVLAASTLGSLVGTFATTHALLPGLGLRSSFLVAALLLGVSGAIVAVFTRLPSHAGAAALGLLAAGFLAPRFEPPAVRAGWRELAHLQSPYQSLRVIEGELDGRPLRLLQVNEGSNSFQSVWRPEPGPVGEGFYYDAFALPAWWSAAEGTWRVLSLGMGAGTALRVLEGASPPGLSIDFTGVEIDPEVVAAGHAFFDLPPAGPTRTYLAGWDARAAVRLHPGDLDLALLDAYAHQVEIPPHLSSVEFFRELRERLKPGGWLAINVGGFGMEDPVVRCVVGSATAAFARPALVLRVPTARNFVVFLRRDALATTPDDAEWIRATPFASELLGPMSLPGAWRVFEPGELPACATDDRNPLEQLQRRSLREARERLRGRI